jgi:DNA-directed RNA polymerase specialized sigma24 family protein
MVLRYVEHLSSSQISRVMGMPQDNIEYIIRHFTKRILEKSLKEEAGCQQAERGKDQAERN